MTHTRTHTQRGKRAGPDVYFNRPLVSQVYNGYDLVYVGTYTRIGINM